MPLNRRMMIFGLATSAICLPHSVAAGQQITGGYAFGSTWRVVTDSNADRPIIRSTINAIIAEVDMAMSPYRPESDLSGFNANHTSVWQRMPQSLCMVTQEALRIADMTDGAFDPTVGPIVARYGFGPISGAVGHYRDIEIGENALRKGAPRLTLDLCGIAKGYALDRIVSSLLDLGVMNALVEVGGEVKAIGHHPTGRAWQVAIVDPNTDDFGVQRVIAPGGQALATSGHSANGLGGKFTTSHIIDPHRGRPAATSLASVSVLAPTAMQADALATALCAAGPNSGIALARSLNIAALFVLNHATVPSEVMTGNFSNHVLA